MRMARDEMNAGNRSAAKGIPRSATGATWGGIPGVLLSGLLLLGNGLAALPYPRWGLVHVTRRRRLHWARLLEGWRRRWIGRRGIGVKGLRLGEG
jgi:hypothetical protein